MSPINTERKRKMLKKCASLALAVCLFACMCFPASAAVIIPDGTFSSDYFISYGCVINDNGGHTIRLDAGADIAVRSNRSGGHQYVV